MPRTSTNHQSNPTILRPQPLSSMAPAAAIAIPTPTAAAAAVARPHATPHATLSGSCRHTHVSLRAGGGRRTRARGDAYDGLTRGIVRVRQYTLSESRRHTHVSLRAGGVRRTCRDVHGDARTTGVRVRQHWRKGWRKAAVWHGIMQLHQCRTGEPCRTVAWQTWSRSACVGFPTSHPLTARRPHAS